MPRKDINDILKKGSNHKLSAIDYSSDEKQKELKELKEKRDAILKNKEVDWQTLSSFIISK